MAEIAPNSLIPVSALPAIPAKRYFTIGEVSDLCGVKPHVLRYWEQEFNQLKPVKRRGNRRYYQHHEVLLIRRIRELLYEQGFTISGARNRLSEGDSKSNTASPIANSDTTNPNMNTPASGALAAISEMRPSNHNIAAIRQGLLDVLQMLKNPV
jgi:DNA-binding transcriptional MerR regulator